MMTDKSAEKRNMMQSISKKLDIPAESFSDAARITISGGTRVLLEGHHGLVEYAEDRISVAGKGCRVIIKGEGLVIQSMSGHELVVTGRLWAVEFE